MGRNRSKSVGVCGWGKGTWALTAGRRVWDGNGIRQAADLASLSGRCTTPPTRSLRCTTPPTRALHNSPHPTRQTPPTQGVHSARTCTPVHRPPHAQEALTAVKGELTAVKGELVGLKQALATARQQDNKRWRPRGSWPRFPPLANPSTHPSLGGGRGGGGGGFEITPHIFISHNHIIYVAWPQARMLPLEPDLTAPHACVMAVGLPTKRPRCTATVPPQEGRQRQDGELQVRCV
jgi:hypothetical protein